MMTEQYSGQSKAVTSTQSGSALVVSFTSGKGGVGKTLSAINMAIAASQNRKKVLIVDADFGLANVDIVLGLHGRYNINDVFEGRKTINDIILSGPLGIDVIPSGSGLANLSDLGYVKRLQLLEALSEIEHTYELIIIDTGAGISNNVIQMNLAADQVVVVTSNEPHAMTDAYAIIKILWKNNRNLAVSLLVNGVLSKDEGIKVWRRLADVCDRYLNAELRFMGSVPFDQRLRDAVRRQNVGSHQTSHTIAGQQWNRLWHEVSASSKQVNRDIGQFFREFVQADVALTM